MSLSDAVNFEDSFVFIYDAERRTLIADELTAHKRDFDELQRSLGMI